MRRLNAILLLLCLPVVSDAQDLTALKANTIYLSSDALGGRGPGSEGGRTASAYIAEQFRAVGLAPFDGKGYFQSFVMPGQATPERNVIGIIRASTPTTRSIVFTAHYDGYGIRPDSAGTDSIYNAAQDNAAGVAGLIELARMFVAKAAPSQNLVFIATAAEEGGARGEGVQMSGAEFYARNPVFPLSDVSMNLNIDGFNNLGPAAEYWMMPRQGVSFVDEIVETLRPLPSKYTPPDWVDGMNQSFDTRVFLRRGVPAVTLWNGFTLRAGAGGVAPKFGRIHSPSDEYNETWRFDGATEFLRMYEVVADRLLRTGQRWRVTDTQLFQAGRD